MQRVSVAVTLVTVVVHSIEAENVDPSHVLTLETMRLETQSPERRLRRPA
jgi:hypothetical protein